MHPENLNDRASKKSDFIWMGIKNIQEILSSTDTTVLKSI